MYYPYVRGRHFEFILLRENTHLFTKHGMHPIIETVRDNMLTLNRTLDKLNEEKVSYTLIANPKVGKFKDKRLNKDEINLDNNYTYIGYIIDANTNLSDLHDVLNEYNNYNISIIHCGFNDGRKLAEELNDYQNIKNHIFIDQYSGKLYQSYLKNNDVKFVLIRDGFKLQRKNVLYPPSEYFSDLHITYKDENMDGFGDFLIAGDDYSDFGDGFSYAGGPAWAVVTHLTYLKEDNNMFIYHFLSEQTDSPANPAGKFLEALEKMEKEINRQGSLIFRSQACVEFLRYHKSQHYPGLGYAKKLSMQHHVELISNYFDNLNREG